MVQSKIFPEAFIQNRGTTATFTPISYPVYISDMFNVQILRKMSTQERFNQCITEK